MRNRKTVSADNLIDKSSKSMVSGLLPVAFLLIVAVITPAQNPNAGTTAFSFLNLGYDARTVAMAGASTAMPNDIYGVLSNPAAVGFTESMQIMGGYRQIMMDVWGGPLGFSGKSRFADMVFAPHIITTTSGDFDIIDESGARTGESAASTYTAAGVTAARIVSDGLSVGLTVKGMFHYIKAGSESFSAEGIAADVGVQYRANNRLIYGAALRNFGIMYGYWGEWNEYDMPYGVEVGVSFIPRHIPELRAALDINKYKGDYANIEPAVEYAVLKNMLFLRGGYAFSWMDFEKMLDVFRGERDDTYQKSNINTLSLGVGVAAVMDNVEMRLDAAMQFYTDISPAVILSLLVVF